MIELAFLYLILRRRLGNCLEHLSYDALDSWIDTKAGTRLWVPTLSLVLLLGACFYVRLDTVCVHHGAFFAGMTADPFTFSGSNPVACRILTPVLSYLIGLRHGSQICLTNLIIAGSLLGAVYTYFKREAVRPGDAFVATVAIASSLVVLSIMGSPGYTDVTSYLLIFLMWWQKSRRWLFYGLFLLALLNHEWVLFMLPWLVFVSTEDCRSKPKLVVEMTIGFGLPVLAYYCFREWVTSQQELKFTVDFYLKPFLSHPFRDFLLTLPYHSLGWFSVFKAMWIVPVVALTHAWSSGSRRTSMSIMLLLASSWAALAVARDTSRMFTLGFMVMPVALQYLFQTGARRFHSWILWVLLLNLIIPQFVNSGHIMVVWNSVSTHIVEWLIR
ncbi:MAG: hypothetical protein ABIE70_02230 [bacterium]